MSKVAKVTMVENIITTMMIFSIMGKVTNRNRCNGFAPSIAAASYSSCGIDLSAARYMIMKNGRPYQTPTMTMQMRAHITLESHGTASNPNLTAAQLSALWVGSKIHHQPRLESAGGLTQATSRMPR